MTSGKSHISFPILFVVLAAILFSTGGLFIKLSTLNAYELSFGRSLIAAIIVALLTRREGYGINRITLLASLLYAALLILFVVAAKLTTVANAIFLQYTAPIYVLILEPIFYGEKKRRSDLFVVGFCILGMSLFFVGKLRPEDIMGNIAALGSGICFALFLLLLRHPEAREVNRASPVIYGNLLLALATSYSFFSRTEMISTRDFLIILYLGVFQIGLAYAFFTLGIARGVRSLDAGIVAYIEPVLNPVWVFVFLGERPTKWSIIGGSIIIAAVVTHTIWGTREAADQVSAVDIKMV